MHELTVAQNIIELAEEVAEREKVSSIKEMDIEIGILSGVVPDALEFALEMIRKNTKLENTEIHFTKIEGRVVCRNCGFQFDTNDLLVICTECSHSGFNIIDGKQLRIKSLIV